MPSSKLGNLHKLGASRSLRWVVIGLFLALAICANAQLANSAWPKFRGNAVNNAQNVGANAIATRLWSTPINGAGNNSSPVVDVDGTVYVGGSSTVYALEPVLGGVKWSFSTGGTSTTSAAVGSNGLVYIGSANPGSSTGNALYALNTTTGKVQWTFNSTSPIFSSPAIDINGTVYVATFGGSVYALDGTTGNTNWVYTSTLGGQDRFNSSPAILTVYDGNGPPVITIYIGSENGYVYCINSDGTLGWDYLTGGAVESSPAVGGDGTAYVGADDGNIYSISNGTKNWSYSTGGKVISSPALGNNGVLYVGSEDQHLYAITAMTGNLLWTTSIGVPIDSSPALGADGTVYTGADAGKVLAISGATGASLWSYATSSSTSSPAIAGDGTLYVGSGTDLIAFQSVHAKSLVITPNSVLCGQPVTGSVSLNLPAPAWGAYIAFKTDNPAAFPPQSITIPYGLSKISFTINTNGVNSPTLANVSATPGYNVSAPVTVNPANKITVNVNPTEMEGGGETQATVTINGPAGGPDGIGVGVSVQPSTGITINKNKPVKISAGGVQTQFPIDTSPVDKQTVCTVSVSANGLTASCTLALDPAQLVSLTINPTSVAGGNQATATITLDGAAGPSGAMVAISSSNGAALVPTSVTVPPGQMTTTFAINTVTVNSSVNAIITANLLGVPQQAKLTIVPVGLASLTFSPSSVPGPQTSIGTITLNAPAPVGGIPVALTSNSSVATVPKSVTIAQGQTSTIFTVNTVIVNAAVADPITATQTVTNGQGTVTATLTVTPAVLVSLSLSPGTVLGGTSVTGTLTLSGATGSAGEVVSLSSSSTSAVVPATVSVAAGASTATFTITTTGVNVQTTSNIVATLQGASKTALLTISPTALLTFTINPTVVAGGNPSTASIVLTGPASPQGTVITLTSSNAAATVPASVTVAPGQTTATATISTTGVATLVYSVITGLMNGQLSQTLTVTIPTLTGVSMNPPTIAGQSQTTGVVSLSGVAGPGGLLVILSSNSKLAAVPSTLFIPAGSGSATFPVTTGPVTVTSSATITARLNGVVETATLTMAPIGLGSVSVSPTSIAGGTAAVGTVMLNGLAPKGGTSVHLSSSISAASVPGSVLVPAGQATASFAVKTTGVSSEKVSTITAKFGVVAATTTLTITPAVLVSVSVSPSSVTGGLTTAGTVTLSGAAAPGGIVVDLSCSLAGVTVPKSVTILSGKLSANFTIKTASVSSVASATITASLGEVNEQAQLTVNPPAILALKLSAASVVGGKSTTGTVTINVVAPVGGIVITLSSSSSDASTAGSVTIPAGKTSATFSVSTIKSGSKTTSTITATLGSSSKSAVLTII